MELKGKPGEEVWIKAQVNFVQIGLEGVSYFVDIEGQLVQFPESAVMAVKREEPQEEPEEEPKGYSIMDPELPAVKYETPEAPRRRGRPKKATVEGLMAKAEQAKIRNEADAW